LKRRLIQGMKKPAAADGGYNNGWHTKPYASVSNDTTEVSRFGRRNSRFT
jgi:hypothetical protein